MVILCGRADYQKTTRSAAAAVLAWPCGARASSLDAGDDRGEPLRQRDYMLSLFVVNVNIWIEGLPGQQLEDGGTTCAHAPVQASTHQVVGQGTRTVSSGRCHFFVGGSVSALQHLRMPHYKMLPLPSRIESMRFTCITLYMVILSV
jgi:hypothetical protein